MDLQNITWATRQENTTAQVNNKQELAHHMCILLSGFPCLVVCDGKEKEIPIYTSNPTGDILTP